MITYRWRLMTPKRPLTNDRYEAVHFARKQRLLERNS